MLKFFRMRNLITYLIIISLLFIGCTNKQPEKVEVAVEETVQQSAEPKIEKIDILHFNDFHAAFIPSKNAEKEDMPVWSGAAVIAGYINKFRNDNPNGIVAFAGDMIVQSPLEKLTSGEFTVDIMNKFKPDIATVGNHEFDFGRERFEELKEKMQFPIVSANLMDGESNELLAEPYKIITTANDVKILVIGLYPEAGKGFYEKHYNIKIGNAFSTVKKYIKEAADQADFVLILSHLGFDDDVKLSEKLGKNSGAHLIIGGHSHTLIESIDKELPVPVVQLESNGTYLGRLEIEFDLTSKTIQNIKYKVIPTYADKIEIDEEINELVKAEMAKIPDFFVTIATTESPLSNISRFDETPLGNFATDVLVEIFKADAAFFGSKMIRNSIPGPEITKNDIHEAFPFEGEIYKVEMTGGNIIKMFEYYLNKRKDRYLHFSHTLFYTYSLRGENIKISELLFKDKPINKSKKYTLVFDERGAKDAEKFYDGSIVGKVGDSFADEYVKFLEKKKVYKPYKFGRTAQN